jgi:transposase-like protein
LSQEWGSSDGDGQLIMSHGSAFVSPSSLSAEIIQHARWLYLRFTLSYRDVEELLTERGLDVSYETVRRWVLKFGPLIALFPRRAVRRPRSACLSWRAFTSSHRDRLSDLSRSERGAE